MVPRLCSRCLPGAAIVACLVLYGSSRTGAQGPSRLTVLPREVVHSLLTAYERGDYDAFDALASRHAGMVANWLSFEADAQLWIGEPPVAPKRPLVAATVALELANVQRGSWTGARMLVEAGCMLVQQQAPSDAELLWHQAANALAVSMGDFDLLIDDPDLTREERAQAHTARAALVTQMRQQKAGTLQSRLFEFLAHTDHAAARFPETAEFRLQGAIAHEFNRVGRNETIFVARDVPIWMDPGAVEKLIATGVSQVRRLPPSRRMGPSAALKLLSMDPNTAAAHTSLVLWNVAELYTNLIDAPAVSGEAHLRLGQTYTRLARPTLALEEFAKAEQSTDASVRYLAHLFAGAVHERLGKRSPAILSLTNALREWPRAQSATFALAPLLLEEGDPEMAASLMESAVARPTVADPLHEYWTGHADRWPRALGRLREALR